MRYYVSEHYGEREQPGYDMIIQGADALRLELWYLSTLFWEKGEQVGLISIPDVVNIVETVERFQRRNPEIFRSNFKLEVRG